MTKNSEFDVPKWLSARNATDRNNGAIVIAISSIVAITALSIWVAIRATTAAQQHVEQIEDTSSLGTVDHWSGDGRAFAVRRPRA